MCFSILNSSGKLQRLNIEIDQYGLFGADTDVSVIHGLIADTDNLYCQNLKIFSASISKT